MNAIYSGEKIEGVDGHSIMLCGPTPRNPDVKSWRPDAIKFLDEFEYDGCVFIPENRDWNNGILLGDVEWEKVALNTATVVCFWMPRKMGFLDGMTSNIEFGRYIGSGKVIYGRPVWAEHCTYMDWMYRDVTGKAPYNDLKKLVIAAARMHKIIEGNK